MASKDTSTVKLEGNQESVTEIQTYLETFNKEIEGQSEQAQQVQLEGIPSGDEGVYYVDSSGQYYYSTNAEDNQVMTQVQIQEVEENADSQAGDGDEEEQYRDIEELEQTEEMESTTNNENASPVVIDSSNAYQTVTIVPSDSNPDEVSYVLIVAGDGEGKEEQFVQEGGEGEGEDGEQDMTVFDFEDNEDNDAQADSEADDDKGKIVKVMPKKSQTVTQAHMCNYCSYTSPKRYLLSRHMKSHSEERPHKCSVCERGFKTLASLQNHVNTHTGTKPHHCKFCDSAFTTSGELVRHVRYRHTHEKPHKCKECDYASVELSKLKRHIRCHTGERPYQCHHCTYASPDTFKLKRHLRIHTGEKPYVCDICQSRFTQSNSLKAHKLIHNVGDKPVFQCELCPAKCGRKTDLRIHVQKLHTSDKPLKCKRCGKSFPDRYSYKLHSKTHEGEKCYKCDLCPYASVSARHLESHILIHTDQKPYQCDQCYQSFRQKQLLKRHRNLYHNPAYVPPPPQEKTHQCPECERPFRHKGNLIRHMAVHDPESSVQEKQQALKIGRQKKIQIIDGQRVEVMTGCDGDEEEEEEEDEEEMLAEGGDGPRYVVLEVFHIDGNQEDGEQVSVIAEQDGDIVMHDPLIDQEEEMITGSIEEEDEGEQIDGDIPEMKLENLSSQESNSDLKKHVDTCFGFSEDEEDDDKASHEIHLLPTIS